MPRKTLLIGLGSKGCDMVSRALDRVIVEFGSLDNAPWLKVLGIDTAPIPQTPGSDGWRLAATRNVVPINLGAPDFAPFANDPGAMSEIDFPLWHDAQTFRTKNATEDGAGGVRMIGRASFLHPKSFNKVHDEVFKRTNALRNLDLPRALEDAGLSPLPEGADHRAIRIFVCGSLTGGTSSGSFLDLGYYLNKLGNDTEFSVYGVFALPHPDCGKTRAIANGHAALTELNHFFSDFSKYEQRFPIPSRFPDRIVDKTQPPYKRVALVMARSGNDDSLDPMHESVAEYLYAISCSSMTDALLAKIIDPDTAYSDVKHKGSHMRFQTFGVANLLFPADHIARGAATGLAADALEEWLSRTNKSVNDFKTELNQHGFNLRQMFDFLLRPATGADGLRERIDSKLEEARTQIASDNRMMVPIIVEAIEDGFESKRIVEGSIGANVIPQTIRSRTQPMRSEWMDKLSDWTNRLVLSIDLGPNDAVALVQAVQGRVAELRQELNGLDSGPLKAGVDKQWAHVEEASSSLLKAMVWSASAREMFGKKYAEASRAYYGSRLDSACAGALREFLGEVDKWAVRTLARLNGSHPRSLLNVSREVVSYARTRYDELNGRGPKVNGVAVFHPGKSVPDEHMKAMAVVDEIDNDDPLAAIPSTRLDEAYARAWILREWEFVRHQNAGDRFFPLTTEGSSPMDAQIDADDRSSADGSAERRLDELIAPALRRFYAELYERDVLKEVFGDQAAPNAGAIAKIDSVVSAARPFLDVDDTGSNLGTPGPQDNRIPSFAFYPGANTELYPYGKFRQSLMNEGIPSGNQAPSNSKTRATILRSRTTIAAQMINGIKGYGSFVKQIEDAIKSPGEQGRQGRLESRGDIPFRKLDGSPLHPSIDEGMAYFLFGLSVQAIRRTGQDRFRTEIPNLDPIPLPADLELAGLKVCENPNLSASLFNIVEKWSPAHHADELAAKVYDIVQHLGVTAPELEFRNAPLKSEVVEDVLLALLEVRAKPAFDAYCQRYLRADEPMPAMYYLDARPATDGGKSKPQGYFCRTPGCEQHIGEKAREAELPDICPNCQVRLFKRGWRARYALKLNQPAPPTAGVQTGGFGPSGFGPSGTGPQTTITTPPPVPVDDFV